MKCIANQRVPAMKHRKTQREKANSMNDSKKRRDEIQSIVDKVNQKYGERLAGIMLKKLEKLPVEDRLPHIDQVMYSANRIQQKIDEKQRQEAEEKRKKAEEERIRKIYENAWWKD